MVGLEDWNNTAEFKPEHYVDTEHSVEGGASLRIQRLDKNEATIYSPSLNSNKPSSEGRIETTIRRTSQGRFRRAYTGRAFMAIVLRYLDIDNYYCVVGAQIDRGGDEPGLVLYRRKDGNTKRINSVKVNRFSDGTYVDDGTPSWVPFRITWFVDKMDAFRIRIQEDANNDDNWEETGGALVDPDPVLGPDDTKTGSGIGFGTVAKVDDRNDKGLWIDQTKLYYGQN